MGYFSNGTEGESYEARYCNQCVHQGPLDSLRTGCAVWSAHVFSNYEECEKKDSILHQLIPRSIDGLTNEPCRMFHPSKAERGA